MQYINIKEDQEDLNIARDNKVIDLEEIMFGNSSNKDQEILDFRVKTEFLLNQPAKPNASDKNPSNFSQKISQNYELTFTKDDEEL